MAWIGDEVFCTDSVAGTGFTGADQRCEKWAWFWSPSDETCDNAELELRVSEKAVRSENIAADFGWLVDSGTL